MTHPRRRLTLDLREERGATVVIVALVLVAMFGMMVLVVDVGGLLWKRRELVNGSDAAALSAASTCALPISVDPKTAEQAADPLAAQNVTGLDPTTTTNATVLPSTCHTAKSGGVKVQYSQQQHLFFAPVLGFSNQNGVTTKAYAIWGPAGAANPVPIVIYTTAFQGQCDVSANLPPGTLCYMWFDNDRFTNSAFGFLNLNATDPQKGWDVGAADQCPNVGSSTRNGWINQTGSVADLPVHYRVDDPQPTYVCRVSGLATSDWSELRSRVGDVVTFPMDDCTQNVDQNGNLVTCFGNADKYDIIGFIDFTLQGVFDQATGPNGWGGTAQQNCSFTAKKVPNTAPNNVVSLLGQSPIGQCPQSDPTVPTPPGGGLINLTVNGQPPGATYTYDATSQTITWNGADQADLNISFDWWVNGKCGQPPTNSSAVCIQVTTVAVHVGGSNPCPLCSPFSNIRAVKLCDPAVTGSCNGVNVPT
jgi:Flp pilus assembly protein TadG